MKLLANIFWTALFWIGLGICVLVGRNAFAAGCEGGFVGQLDSYYPDGTHEINTDNLQGFAVNKYKMTLSYIGYEVVFPFDALIPPVSITSVDCTYHIAYNADPIFHDGFEGN